MDCGWSGSTKGPRVEEPEPAVVRAAMDGDLAAFERLVRCYQAHVWRFLRHLLGDAALAEDVTQETFLRLYRRLPTFAGRSAFSTWVFRIARHAGWTPCARPGAATGCWRRCRHRRRGPPPDARVEAMAAVASLSPSARGAAAGRGVRLHLPGGRGVLAVPEGTVKSRVFQARVRLTRLAGRGSGRGGR